MHPTVRRDYLIASCLYFSTIAFYGLPALYLMLPQPLGPARHHGLDTASIVIIVGTVLLLLSLFIGMGLGIRAGKTWAKVVFCLFLAWVCLTLFRHPSTLATMSARTWSSNLFSLALLLGIIFFLFRNHFTRRPAAADEPI